MPPGTDDLPGKKPPERNARRGGGRKPGRQPGAPGAYLACRTRPAALKDPAEDLRPPPLGETTRDRYAIRGYASTAAKHGTAVFTAIRDALAGNPWMPPIPASG